MPSLSHSISGRVPFLRNEDILEALGLIRAAKNKMFHFANGAEVPRQHVLSVTLLWEASNEGGNNKAVLAMNILFVDDEVK